jgi:hypothetical protein
LSISIGSMVFKLYALAWSPSKRNENQWQSITHDTGVWFAGSSFQ